MTATIVALCLSLALAIGLWGTRATGAVALFSVPLHPTQAAEVERALTIWNEPFSSNAQHSEILVPSGRRREVLLRLTLAGLPHGYVPTSADVLDDSSSMLLSPAVADDRRRTGIEGDLVSGLRRIVGIMDATVVIAPGTANPLDDTTVHTDASASVQLLLQPGVRLSADQISGIARFVAASYPGLSVERVAIVDGSGALQSVPGSPEPSISRELRLQNSIQSALDAVLGLGASVVRVSIRNDIGESSSQITRTYPHGLLQSESARETGREKSRAFEKDHSVRRYAYDTIVETRSTPKDATARVAVAVFLDEAKAGDIAPATLTDLVRAAAGVDRSRGDELVVKMLRFRLLTDAQSSAATDRSRAFAKALAVLGIGLVLVGSVMAWSHIRDNPAARRGKAAAALAATIQHELPQTAAYILRSVPVALQKEILNAYEPAYRARIEMYLTGARHG